MAPAVQTPNSDERPSSWDKAITAPGLPTFTDHATAPSQGRPAPPSALGRYSIEVELGRGMMGVVYRAMDPVLDRKVALKVVQLPSPLREEEQRLMEQGFLREARLAARLTHPHIVGVHDVGWDAETRTPFMALEYLEGQTLANALAAAGDGLARSAAARLAAGRRPAPRARARHRAPRHQAREHHDPALGRREDHGLQHRPGSGRREDRQGRVLGNASLHVA